MSICSVVCQVVNILISVVAETLVVSILFLNVPGVLVILVQVAVMIVAVLV